MESKAALVEINVFDVEGKPVEPPIILDLETDEDDGDDANKPSTSNIEVEVASHYK